MKILNLTLGIIGMLISLKPIGHYWIVKTDVARYKNNAELVVDALKYVECTADELIQGMNITLAKAKIDAILGILAFVLMIVVLICVL